MYHDHEAFKFAPMGYRMVYRKHETNHCPGCGQQQWIVGRASAECAFCGTPVPLQRGQMNGAGLVRARGKTDRYAPLAA